jgi:molecular chaperone GrpE
MNSDPENTGAAVGETPDDIDDVRRELADAQDKWQRSAADLANFQKRFQRETERGQIAERERVLNLWLNTVDDLERALAHAESDGVEPGAEAALVQGIRAVTSQAVNTIAGLGYPRVGLVGDTFNPMMHDVVSTVPPTNDVDVNIVAAVVKPGYGTPDHLLRPATVVVAKAPD